MNIDQIATMILEMTTSVSVENLENNNNQDITREKIKKRVEMILNGGCRGCPPNDPECCTPRFIKIIKILKLVKDFSLKSSDFSNSTTYLTNIDETMELIEKIYKDEEI